MKKVLSSCLALLLILSGITVSFAAESGKTAVAAAGTAATPSAIETTGSAVVIPDMTFTGTTIKLSLDAAYTKMLSDSSGAKMAELNKQSAYGISQGYGESVRLINKAQDAGRDYSTTSKNILKLQQEYAVTQGPKNYQSEVNKLKNDTLENYYSLKELENQVQIAKDNLALKEKLLNNTQLKYKLGTVSKSDVLQAETSMLEAKDGLVAAQNGLDSMKMGFNQFMGYGLMQNVTLTDIITEVPLSGKTLESSIKEALVNRNEIASAKFGLQVATLNLENYKAYPSNSSKFISAKIAMLMAQTNYDNAPLTVESDVRTKYMTMQAKYSAVQTGKKAVENAKESARLAQLQYDAGMATLSDVEGAQLAYYNEQLDYSKALLEYNLAVNAYELSSTVGTTAASID